MTTPPPSSSSQPGPAAGYTPVRPVSGEGAADLRSLRLIVASCMIAAVVVAIVVTVLLPRPMAADTQSVMPIVPIAVAIIGPMIATFLQRQTLARVGHKSSWDQAGAFRSTIFVGFALTEAGVMVAVAMSFVVQGALPVWVCAPITVVAMATLVYPSASVIRRADATIEAAGGKGWLGQHYGTSSN